MTGPISNDGISYGRSGLSQDGPVSISKNKFSIPVSFTLPKSKRENRREAVFAYEKKTPTEVGIDQRALFTPTVLSACAGYRTEVLLRHLVQQAVIS